MNDLLSLSGVSNHFTKQAPAISSTYGGTHPRSPLFRQKGLCQISSSSFHIIRSRPRELLSFTELAYRVIMKLRSNSAHSHLSSFYFHIIGKTCVFSKVWRQPRSYIRMAIHKILSFKSVRNCDMDWTNPEYQLRCALS